MTNALGGEQSKLSQVELTRVLASHERYALGRGGARAQLKGVNLDGCVLANRKLNEVDFSGASLVGANLYGSSLVRASLFCADLRRCNLRNATLAHADIRGAAFNGADLSFAVLDNADLRSATMMIMSPGGVSKIDHVSDGEGFGGVDFSHCSLRNSSFGKAKLDGANFTGALLLGTSFRGAQMPGAKFIGAVLMGVNISELNLPPDAFIDCVFDVTPQARARAELLKGKLARHQEWVASDGKDGAAAAFDGEDLRAVSDQFSGRSLVGLAARGAIGVAVDFSGCQLQGAKFDGADLRAANFTGADLSGTSFHGAKLNHARFDKARLGNLHMRSGEVLTPNLLGADADPSQFLGAFFDESLAALGLPVGVVAEI
jgi:uncharacterized protein YjbI with pentapeptide repeats